MNCPKCGLQALPEQKFCRSCGASLQITTQPLAEQVAVSELQRTPVRIVAPDHHRTNRLMLSGFILLFVGAAIGVIGKKLIHADVITVVGILISLAGMFLTVYPHLSPSRARHEPSRSTEPEVLSQPRPPRTLPERSNAEYVPSITERTTDLLKNSAARRSTEEERRESQS
jgi:hypothetical protein